ncbi:MAG: hypothetical protein HC767_00450 [Akkermansiaceae bacterium]|nr:hypothetical protein [Akkermansiaceae bacterium]
MNLQFVALNIAPLIAPPAGRLVVMLYSRGIRLFSNKQSLAITLPASSATMIAPPKERARLLRNMQLESVKVCPAST